MFGSKANIGKTASALLATSVIVLAGAAATAQELPDEISPDPAYFNPHEARTDLILPMPGGLNMVFTPIEVLGTGHWGRKERIFTMGTEDSSRLFEPRTPVRIGGTVAGAGQKWILYVGKYEVSRAQYAAVAGNGDIAAGVADLIERTGNKRIARRVGKGGPKAVKELAKPVNLLPRPDMRSFVTRYNDWCYTTPRCLAKMPKASGGGREAPGFFRLPTEHEWEYVARGGGAALQELLNGKSKAFTAQLPIPVSDLQDYAHFDAPKKDVLPIGSKKPLYGLYDVFGNVSELMANPFYADLTSGKTGGSVSRGGSFRTGTSGMRASARTELRPYTFRSSLGTYVPARERTTGMRLVIATLVTTSPKQRKEMQEAFSQYIPLYPKHGTNLDLAGNSRSKAKDLGSISTKQVRLADDVGGEDDRIDYFKLSLREASRITIRATTVKESIRIRLAGPGGFASKSYRVDPGRETVVTERHVFPNVYYLAVSTANRKAEASYDISLDIQPDDDAGSTSRTAFDIGYLEAQTREFTEFLGSADRVDYYRMQLTSKQDISINLMEFDVDLNVEIRDGQDNLLKEAKTRGADDEFLVYSDAPPGEYFIRVYPAGKGNTKYRLLVAAGSVDTAGNDGSSARDLGLLTNNAVSLNEAVGHADKQDFYRLRVKPFSELILELGNLQTNADITLQNAAGREITASAEPGTKPERIRFLTEKGGTFLVNVRSSSSRPTRYVLSVRASKFERFSEPEVARRVSLSSFPTRFNDTVQRPRSRKYARFTVSGTTMGVKFALDGFSSRSNLDLFIMDRDDKVVSRSSSKIRGAREEIITSLEPGTYYALVYHRSGPATDFRVSMQQFLGMIDPKVVGEVVSENRDWRVGTKKLKTGQKICFAYTVATDVSSGFAGRIYKPFLYISVRERAKVAYHTFDLSGYYNRVRSIRGHVNSGGRRRPLPLQFVKDSNEIQSLVPCKRGSSELCISSKALRGLTRGSSVTLRGTSKAGNAVRVDYSLLGYKSSARQIVRMCSARTRWLVQ